MFSIRLLLLYGFMTTLVVYAWGNWFVSLCGLVLLTVLIEHPEMPTNIMGIQGLNPWNIVLAGVMLAWLATRRGQGLRWDAPRSFRVCLGLFLLATVVTFLRGVMDLDSLPATHPDTPLTFTSDHIINPLKLMLPGIMLFDGVRTRRRMVAALLCVLALGVGYALQVLRCMSLELLTGAGDFMIYRYRINKQTGLHANDMAMLLVGYFWAICSCYRLFAGRWWRIGLAGAAVTVFLGMALCFSRAGYLSFAGLAVVFGVLRWRWILPVLPVAALLTGLAFPSIPARLGMGFGVGDSASQEADDITEITSGRATSIWPPVLAEISSSPVLGSGRRAILRTNAYDGILAFDGVVPNHPHNAYLEVLLDAGIVGLFCILPLYALLFLQSARFLRSASPLLQAVGGAALAPVAALLITGLSSQSLFPTVSMFGMWCAAGLLIRLSVVVAQARTALAPDDASAMPVPNRFLGGLAR